MAGVFASMAVKWALDKLASFLPASLAMSSSTTVNTASEDVELLRKLERTMLRIRATLHDVEEHWNIREETTKLRLKELKELAYAAEDVMEEYENEVDRCELEANAASVGNGKRKRQEAFSNGVGMVPVPDELVRKARGIIQQLDEIKEYSHNFDLSADDGERWYVPDISTLRQTSSFCDNNIIGREKDKDHVVEILLSEQSNNVARPVSVLAIVGMGGLGKTTLAQLVYNDPRVRQCFDVFAWVCVSEQFDVRTITKNIISSVTNNSCDLSQLADLQDKLVREVRDKKVLLVLDDVWNERSDQWGSLCVPMSRTRICNIVVTTRNEPVAKLVQTTNFYRMKGLSSEDSRSLFKQVGFAAPQDNDIPANLIQIGNDIVDKCKGLPLAIKTLGSILRFNTDETTWRDVLESKLWDLKQSHNEVLPALELSYKHMPIYLKRCFIALSLFPKDYHLWESEMVKLWKSLDLLQCDRNGKEDDIGRIYINELVQRSLLEVYAKRKDVYVMHDLIHDLACFLGSEEFFRIEGDTCIEIPSTVRYISVSRHGAFPTNLPASHSIRAIVIFYEGILQEFPLNCKKLRAVCHLYKPETGILLPHRIECGINIHTLDMGFSGCGSFCNISGLRSLNKMRELYLSGLSYVACIEDAEGAQLQNKKHLRSLTLDFLLGMYNCKNRLPHKQLLESLRPHHVLRKIEINYYQSERYPSWLGNASYSNLTEVSLEWCSPQHLPTLGELPSLKSLKVHSMDQVEKIGREFCSHIPGVKGFPSLTRLEFKEFKKLSEWSEVDVGEFPCLQILSIYHAKELRSLPPALFMSLVTLRLEYCGNLTTIPAAATLRELVIEYCENLHQLPALVLLRKLEIRQCPKPSAVGSFPSLTTLNIIYCGNLATIPAAATLRELVIEYCESLHELPTLESLLKLQIVQCPKLSVVGSLRSLTTLNIVSPFDNEKILSRLLNCGSSLEYVTVSCVTTTCITLQLQGLALLTKLHLHCPNLRSCDGLAGLTSLQELDVRGCSDLPIFKNLQDVKITRSCTKLFCPLARSGFDSV